MAGTIVPTTPIAMLNGGTGASTAAAARTALGVTFANLPDAPTLGMAAAQNTAAFDPANAASTVNTALLAHTSNTSNPHSVTAAQVGLGNVNNTCDALKPASTAQAAINANIATNTANIATNTANIATNTTAIGTKPTAVLSTDGTMAVFGLEITFMTMTT